MTLDVYQQFIPYKELQRTGLHALMECRESLVWLVVVNFFFQVVAGRVI